MASTEHQLWTPYMVSIILHHFGSRAVFPRHEAPAYSPTIDELLAMGVLEVRADAQTEHAANETPLTTSALGNALVEMWCAQPLPVARFVDPRFEEQR